MQILGIDPGKACTGVSVIDVGKEIRPALVASYSLKGGRDESMPKFLHHFALLLGAIFLENSIAAVALENIKMARGAAGKVHSEIRGVAKLVAYERMGEDALIEELGAEWPSIIGIKSGRGEDRKPSHVRAFRGIFGCDALSTVDQMEAALVAYALSKKIEVEA